MGNTITAFARFITKTPAKSSEMNGNFGNYRGGFLPVDGLTASASNGTWNLGTSEHRWLGHYTPTMRSDLDAGLQILNNGSTIAAYSSQFGHMQIYNEFPATDLADFGGSWSYARAIGTSHITSGPTVKYVHDAWTATTYGKPVMWKICATAITDVATRHLTVSLMKGQNTTRGTILLTASLTGTLLNDYTIGAEWGPNYSRKSFTTIFRFFDFNPGSTTEVYALLSSTQEVSTTPGGRAGCNLNGLSIELEQIF